jgi:hypothetical protein
MALKSPFQPKNSMYRRNFLIYSQGPLQHHVLRLLRPLVPNARHSRFEPWHPHKAQNITHLHVGNDNAVVSGCELEEVNFVLKEDRALFSGAQKCE